MYKIFDMNGSVYKLLTVGYNLLFLNLLFIVTSLPVITIGPSITAALSLINENNDGRIVFTLKRYIHHFKKNFKSSFILSSIQIGSIALLVLVLFVIDRIPILQLMAILLFSLSLLVTSLFYPILVHYEKLPLKKVISIAMVIALKFTGFAALSFTLPLISVLVPVFLPKLILPYILVVFSVPLYIQHYLLIIPLNRIEIEDDWRLQND